MHLGWTQNVNNKHRFTYSYSWHVACLRTQQVYIRSHMQSNNLAVSRQIHRQCQSICKQMIFGWQMNIRTWLNVHPSFLPHQFIHSGSVPVAYLQTSPSVTVTWQRQVRDSEFNKLIWNLTRKIDMLFNFNLLYFDICFLNALIL